ncbi:ABC transporter ATP-binding protein [Robiginitalea sediminis]|uniref:ABC transporter ATP-binding protein n=1 Tax=Robiginitalea sediminis TaxID=1982593 RepID=UPI000B4BC3E1|nr:ABC transporter ATP-binding protein [Robiginitalea sediminis]
MKPLSEEMALEVRNLRIGFAESNPPISLSGPVDLKLPPGTLTAIVGVNGVGKTTLLRTLCGLHPPLSGDIFWKGLSLDAIPGSRRASLLSIVLTEPPASRNLTVAEMVGLGRHPYTNWAGRFSEEDRRQVAEVLRRMDLETLAHRACHTLSDGQLQRALIARALAQDTPLMLLDEPTTHLDLYHKVKILKTLGQIARDTSKAVVFTTHEIGLALQLCDLMLILKEEQARFGAPCELIEAGDFNTLFPEDAIRFDSKTGTFRVRK